MYIGLQSVSKHQLGLFVRLQPPEHQPCLVKAPTLDLGAPTPRTPILPILRHQPQGLQPSAIYCLEMFGSYSLLPTTSSLNSIYLHLHCYIKDNLSSYEGVFTTLHNAQIEFAELSHDDFK